MWRILALVLLLAACGDGAPGGATAPLATVGETQITRTSSGLLVAGRVKSQAQRPYSASIVVTLFDEGGKIVGTYYGAVNDVAPGDEVTYTAIGPSAPETWAKVEAKVQDAMPR